MGAPMADRLVQGGELVVVFNRTTSKGAQFGGRAKIAATPAEMAEEADVVFACVTTPDVYREVLLGPNGIIRGGRAKTYVHLGTNEACVVAELAAALKEQGIETVDAPITGGVSRARGGTLTAMAAGPRAAFDHALPFMKHYASKVVYMGERVGAAQVMKFVNNVLSASNLALACEAMVLGRKSGLDPKAMLEVLNTGSGQNSATLTKIPAQILTRRFDHGGGLAMMLKDLEAFRGEASLQDVQIPLTEAVIASLRAAMEVEGGDADITRIICPMERAAGVVVS